jgi:hypothetical protein
MNVLFAAVGWNIKKLLRLLWLLPQGLIERIEKALTMCDRSDPGWVVFG